MNLWISKATCHVWMKAWREMEERWERDRAKWAAETEEEREVPLSKQRETDRARISCNQEIEGIRQRKRSEIWETESDTS